MCTARLPRQSWLKLFCWMPANCRKKMLSSNASGTSEPAIPLLVLLSRFIRWKKPSAALGSFDQLAIIVRFVWAAGLRRVSTRRGISWVHPLSVLLCVRKDRNGLSSIPVIWAVPESPFFETLKPLTGLIICWLNLLTANGNTRQPKISGSSLPKRWIGHGGRAAILSYPVFPSVEARKCSTI